MSYLNSTNSVLGTSGQGQTANPGLLMNQTQAQQLVNQMAAQQMMQQYNRALSPQWMIDGRVMSIEEFGKEMFGEDTPELTFFLLKYKDIEEKKT